MEAARGKVPLVKSVSEFWKLKPIQQAHLLVGFIKIHRKGRKLDGERYPNCTYYDFAAVIKRIGEIHYGRKYQEELLENPNAKEICFDLFNDQRFQIFIDALNAEMEVSAEKGLVGGVKKARRTPIKPAYLKKVFELPWEESAVYLEYVTVLVIMLLLAIRGGRELAEKLNWGQFSIEKDESGELLH